VLLPIAIFLALFPMLGSAAGNERNLIQNGNFETATKDWELVDFAKGGTMEIDRTELRNGKPTLKIESFGELTFARQTVKVKARTNYRLTGYIKVKGVSEKGGAGKAGANLIVGMTRIATPAINGTAGWRKVDVEFNTEDKTEIRVGPAVGWYACKVFGTGWFSDLSLTELSGSRQPR
jgi:hypothetical protein